MAAAAPEPQDLTVFMLTKDSSCGECGLPAGGAALTRRARKASTLACVVLRWSLAVVAHVRHVHTDDDALLKAGVERDDARRRVHGPADEVLAGWRGVR
jgi:hypothetical protein